MYLTSSARSRKFDRDEYPPVRADAIERYEKASGVRADDGNPLAVLDADVVKCDGHTPRPGLDLPVGELPEAGCRAGFVNNRRPVPVDQGCPVQKVAHCKRNLHLRSPLRHRPLGRVVHCFSTSCGPWTPV